MPDIASLSIRIDSNGVRSGVSSLKDLKSAASEAAAASSDFERDFARMVKQVASITALTAEFTRATQEALQFSSAMAEVKTVADVSTDLKRTADQMKRLSVEFGSAPTQEANALYQIISAGVSDTAKAMEILNTSNQLAVGGLTDVFTAADGLTSVLAVYGDEVRNAQQASDMMFVAAADGKTRIEDLAHSLGMITSIAKPAGLGLDELLSSVAALTKIMPTTMAVEGLRSALSQIIGPSKEAQKVAAQLGLDFSIAGLKAHGFGAFMQEVQEKTHGSPELMKRLFQDVQGVNAVLSLSGPLADDYANSLDHMRNSAGKTGEAFKTMSETPAFALKQLKEQLVVLETTAGDALVAGLLPGVQALNAHFGTLTTTLTLAGEAAAIFAASKVATTVQRWGAALVESTRAAAAQRAATIESALSQVGYKRAVDESTASALANAAALLEQQKIGIQAAMVSKTMTAQEAQQAFARYRVASAALAEAEAVESASLASRGFGAAMTFMGGPIGLAVAALTAAYFVFDHYAQKAEEARQASEKFGADAVQNAAAANELAAAYRTQAEALGKIPSSLLAAADDYARANESLEDTKKRLLALGPEYRAGITSEVKTYDQLLAVLRKINAERLKKLEIDIKDAQQQVMSKNIRPGFVDMALNALSHPFDSQANLRGQAQLQAEKRAPLEQHLNTLLKERNELEEKMKALDAQAAGETDKHTAAVTRAASAHEALNRTEQKQVDQGERYLQSLHSQASGLEDNWEAAQKASEAYKKLNAAQRAIADDLLDEIQARKDLSSVVDDSARHAKEYAEDLARLRGFTSFAGLAPGHEMQVKKTAKAYEDLVTYLDRTNATFHQIHEMGSTVASDLANGFVAMANGVEGAFGQMVDAILQDLERMLAQKAFEQLLQIGLTALGGLFTGGGAIDATGQGGVIGGSPVLSAMPTLRAPSSVGMVDARSNVVIHVSNDGSISSDVSPLGNSAQAHRLGRAIDAAIQKGIQQELRPGGSIFNASRR